ncbi:hypothetical protein [Streptosporangium sp. NPDC006007]|uniref:hypothetical protein n=1 Tax=Streptosporangium sp. NPDC006007 TaxID=3154575 RepID=UPI0033BC59E9
MLHTTRCRPWCTDHFDGYCLATASTPAGDLLLGFTDGGPRVFLWQLRDVDLTLADAARLHEALGELLAAAPQGELVGGVR